MVQDENLYQKVIADYRITNSVKKTAQNVGTSLVRAQRILITEGLWSSHTSEQVGELFRKGMTTSEISKQLVISEKTVQAYLPYTRTETGYGESRSYNSKKSEDYRRRMYIAADSQVSNKFDEIVRQSKQHDEPAGTIRVMTEHELLRVQKKLDGERIKKKESEEMSEQKYSVLKLRLSLNLEETDVKDRVVLNRYGKVKQGIIREILVPADITLHALHYVIQRAFGWQNSHLHQYLLPEEVFQKMTGGKNRPDEYGRTLYDGKLTDWIDLCGVYFRFPCDDFEDIYWDDDYKQGVSIKTWFRKKYTAPYSYGGKWEHYAFANATAKSLITENPVIRVTPSFDEWMEMKKNGIDVSKQKDKMIPVTDATIEQVGLGFESRMDELLERLKVTEVLAAKDEKVPDDIREAVQFVAKRLAKVNEEIEVTPITKSLKYNYDYGDGWEVDIVMEEKYYTKNRLDTAFEGNVDGFVVVPNEEGLIEEARAYDMSDHLQDELLSKIIQTVEIKGKPICIFADGLPVMDDVGGVHGYIDFLMTSRLGNQEERDEIRDWASGMGWTGRMYKPENIL